MSRQSAYTILLASVLASALFSTAFSQTCCIEGGCGSTCTRWAKPMHYCAASADRCRRCHGQYCPAGTTDPQPESLPRAIPVPVPASDTSPGPFCCVYSPVGAKDKCGACESISSGRQWCAQSSENCDICHGMWCDGGKPMATTRPPPTTATPTTTVPPPVKNGGGNSFSGCCYWSSSLENKCNACHSKASDDSWCAESSSNCNRCAGFWCSDGVEDGSLKPTRAPRTTTVSPATTESRPGVSTRRPTTTQATAPTRTTTTTTAVTTKRVLPPSPPGSFKWTRGTYTTGYWDCCKPSCSWPGKGAMTAPVRACSAKSGGVDPVGPNVASVCDGGESASCVSNQPWVASPRLSFGFAAAAVSGQHGLTGDSNCGECYMLKFTDRIHSNGNWGGSHPDLVGHTMVVQVTNIGYDVNGDHSFDLQLPSAGQGQFTNGCTKQFPGYSSGDFDCDNNYGGCFEKSGCWRLPKVLQSGCAWRYDTYKWFEGGGQTNNPYVDFARVRCPKELTTITGSAPLDDDQYPPYSI